MKTLILQHDDCLRHDMGPKQAEAPARIAAVMSGVAGVGGTEVLPAPRASAEQLLRAHVPEYWEQLVTLEPGAEERDRRVQLDWDTSVNYGSIDATLRGSGAACFAVDQVVSGKAANAFCVVRPPGHHADAGTAMGFCLLNHVAVAARHAQAVHGLERIAILDFDVHHGNGTQAIFETSPEVLFVSSHQMPLYPGTGYPEERGSGNIFNLPLPPGAGSDDFRRTWSESGLSELERHRPQLVFISAGFDAHERDPLGQLELQDADYAWITSQIRSIAESACGGRIVSMLEGGYDLEALASASAAHVEALAAR